MLGAVYLFVSFVCIPVYFSSLSTGPDVKAHMLFSSINNLLEFL